MGRQKGLVCLHITFCTWETKSAKIKHKQNVYVKCEANKLMVGRYWLSTNVISTKNKRILSVPINKQTCIFYINQMVSKLEVKEEWLLPATWEQLCLHFNKHNKTVHSMRNLIVKGEFAMYKDRYRQRDSLAC